MEHFTIATQAYIDTLINKRPNETKLGEHIQTLATEDWQEELALSTARYVLLGIPEDIGVRANYGTGGTHTLWPPALKSFLNIQQTEKLNGDTILLLGHFDLEDLMRQSEEADIDTLRKMVAQIDEIVAPVIEQIVSAGKIPVVIGGGHNNAYPLLKGTAKASGGKANCINLDAHSDYRMQEGRHSGNGFRYAMDEGYLHKYSIIGLHENYNAQNIIDELTRNPRIRMAFYEEIFFKEHFSFRGVIQQALFFTDGYKAGIELDMDSIAGALASAATPVGITPLQARQYICECAKSDNCAYLHITEGAVKLRNGREDDQTARLAAYLISDFVKIY